MSWLDKLYRKHKDPVREAIEWAHRVQTDDDVKNSEEFKEWVRVTKHLPVFDAVMSSVTIISEFSGTPKILRMRRLALESFQSSRKADFYSWHYATAAASALSLVVLICLALFYRSNQPITYTAQFGERRTVALSDGSRILLDSNSQVDVGFTRNARLVTIERGRARFDVAHNINRPFRVSAGAGTVIAVGTAFEVEKLQAGILVTLIQGRVMVQQTDARSGNGMHAKSATTFLSPGEQLTESEDGLPVVKRVDLDTATAWETGRLVFQNVSLGDAVEEVNRYTVHPIAVDPSASKIRISGVFNAGDVNAFIKAVTAYLPVSASTNAGKSVVLSYHS